MSTVPEAVAVSNIPGRLGGKYALKACELCRSLKVRCTVTQSPNSEKCQRCARLGKTCIFVAKPKTRQRRRVDTRVTELEKEVHALRSLLKEPGDTTQEKRLETAIENGSDGSTFAALPTSLVNITARDSQPWLQDGHDQSAIQTEVPDRTMTHNTIPLLRGESSMPQNPANASMSSSEDTKYCSFNSLTVSQIDVVDRGIITIDQATQLFNRYHKNLCLRYPAVVFPNDVLATEVRHRKPVLFLAVITAAAGTLPDNVKIKLNEELVQLYAYQILVKGKKSLELIQALLVTLIWYYPGLAWEEERYFQYAQMAITMALEIGLTQPGKKSRPYKQISQSISKEDLYIDDAIQGRNDESRGLDTMECRRTLLACYLSSTAISLVFRWPNSLRFSEYMSESLDFLEKSPFAASTDKRFAARIRLQQLVEEVGPSIGLDDPFQRASLSEGRTQLALKAFGKQLKQWEATVPTDLVDPCLTIAFHDQIILVHEMALHDRRDSKDSPSSFHMEKSLGHHTRISQARVDAIMVCISSAHALLDALLNMDIATLRALPHLNFVNMCYSVFILNRLFCSATTDDDPISEFLEPASLKLNEYLGQLIPHLMTAAQEGHSRAASKFLMVLMKLAAWYYRQCIRPKRSEISGGPPSPSTSLRRDANGVGSSLRSEGPDEHTERRKRSPAIWSPIMDSEPTVPDLQEAPAQTSHPDVSQHPHFQPFGSDSIGHLDGTNLDRYISQQYSTQTNEPSANITPLTPLDCDQTILPSIQSGAESIPLFSLASDSEVQFNEQFMSYIEGAGILSSQDLEAEMLNEGILGDGGGWWQ